MMFAVNHLAHFHIATSLLPLLESTAEKEQAATTVVVVSSSSHHQSYKEG